MATLQHDPSGSYRNGRIAAGFVGSVCREEAGSGEEVGWYKHRKTNTGASGTHAGFSKDPWLVQAGAACGPPLHHLMSDIRPDVIWVFVAEIAVTW